MQNKVSVQNSSELAEFASCNTPDIGSEWTKLSALSDACVACGLCAPVCPSYAIEATEAQSPRGRVQLIKAIAQGNLVADHSVQDALNGCVGCGLCEQVCPANVQVSALIDGIRVKIAPKRSWRGDLIGAVLARPALTRVLQVVAGFGIRQLARSLRFPMPAADIAKAVPQSSSATIVFSAGCANNLVQPALLEACMQIANALAVPARIQASCCGGYARHRGQNNIADQLVAAFARDFSHPETVVGLTPGCHHEQKQALGAQYLDLVDWLKQIDFGSKIGLPVLPTQKAIRVVLHLPCSVRIQPEAVATWRTLLAKIDGVEYLELDAGITCCGAGGAYRFDQAARSAKLAEITAAAIHALAPDLVLSANVGCLAQLQTHLNADNQGEAIQVLHPLVFILSQRPVLSQKNRH